MLPLYRNPLRRAFMQVLRFQSSPRRSSRCFWLTAAVYLSASPALASDHADPIDPFNKERLEGGITDLFVFPVDANDAPVAPHTPRDGISLAQPAVEQRRALSPEEQKRIEALVVILCVRRQLTETGSLRLEPYTYTINMDLHSKPSFEDSEGDRARAKNVVEQGSGYQPMADDKEKRPSGEEARARYGGIIQHPERIEEDATIQIRLRNDPTKLNGAPVYTGLKNTKSIKLWTGVRDDPFIFPAFFRTNVVAMVLRIPMNCFPQTQQDWLIWATSQKGERQIDHVGRSLRTQNPRFELLNTLHPSEHVRAILDEHEHPDVLRDIALRLNFQQTFAYRKWDFVPDVMIYTSRYEEGFPNGRLLTDDVAALLAQHGDTLLLELSHHAGGWPRRTTNDQEFNTAFPFLAEPWEDRPPPEPPHLSRASWFKILSITGVLLLFLFLENWIIARWYHRWKLRPRHI
jgi:hypothetical protein